MKQDVNNIDNLFREGLGGYTEVPPPDVWDALERRLDNDKKKRPFAWRWFFVMLCGIGLFGSLFAWKMNGHPGETPDAPDASGITAIQQKPASPQAATPGNTSAGANKSTSSIAHKKYAKHKNDINSTTNNTTTEREGSNTPVANNNNNTANTNKPQKTDILDNTAVAMVDVAPAQGETRNPVRYVTSNKNRNNIVVAESEPANTTTNYATADESEEDNVTFGRKPKVDNNEPAPHNTYASHSGYEHTPSVATNRNVSGTAKTSTASKRPAGEQSILPATSSTSHQVAVTNPRNRRSRRGNNNPYSITNNSGAVTTIAHTPTAAKQVVNTVSTTTQDTKTVAVTKPAKTSQNVTKADATKQNTVSATTATRSRSTGGSNTAVAKTDETTIETGRNSEKKTTVKKTVTKEAIAVTTNAAVKKVAVNIVTKPIVAATSPTNATGTKTTANETVAARVPGKKNINTKTTTAGVTNHTDKTTGHKSVAPTTIANVAAGKSAACKNAITAVTPTQAGLKTTKHAIHPTVVTTADASSHEEGGNTPKATHKSKNTAKPSESIAKTNTEEPIRNVTKKKGTTATGKTTNSIVGNTKKKHTNTKNKPEPTNVLGATKAADKQPEQAVAKVTTPEGTPESQKVMKTFKDQPTPSIKPADTTPVPALSAVVPPVDSPVKKFKFGGYTYGVKVGYEGGVTHDASNKLVIAPFIERQISSKFSIMAQPALKSSRARTNGLSGTQTYYKTNPDGTVTNVDSFLIPVIQNNQTTGYLLRINVAYHETHDSIVKSYATGGNYLEFELPIMLKYAINPKLSVYGGVSLNYSKFIQIKEYTYTSRPIVRNDTSFTIYPTAPAPIASVMNYAGNNINSYSGPLYPAQSGGLFRLGYMFGVSYEIRKRWLIDALWTKAPAKTNIQGGYDVNKGLSTSYFRFTLGYRLSK